jgi:hypothetical protein
MPPLTFVCQGFRGSNLDLNLLLAAPIPFLLLWRCMISIFEEGRADCQRSKTIA